MVRGLRSLIPYRAPDVSPYQRPLRDGELRAFAASFSSMRTRAFALPHVALGEHLPIIRNQVDRLYRSDAALLQHFP